MQNEIVAVDMFCGGGGTSSGLIQAAESAGIKLDLTAINHWSLAIETHSKNHPSVRHICARITQDNARSIMKGKRLNLLVASPECQSHSRAAGSRPKNEQSRASAWRVVEWISALRPEEVIVENVEDFLKWGPLDENNKPIKHLEGKEYAAFLFALESLGYHLDVRFLRSADFGDATSRRRIFIRASLHGAPSWPTRTHSPIAGRQAELFDQLPPWRPASEVIDFDDAGTSIFERGNKPLKEKSLDRLVIGLESYCDLSVSVSQLSQRSARPIVRPPSPLPAIKGHRVALQPFLVEYYGTGGAAAISEPLSTITTKHRHGLAQPFIEFDGYRHRLDILYRMLRPRELAAATGFRSDYYFAGNQADAIRQIGNAVTVNLAEALCASALKSITRH